MDIQQNVFFDDVRSTGSIVSDVLRRAIVTQSLPAGTRLVEAKLAKQLNVSITPIRQAFAQLAREGLLNVFPYKGTFVATITEKYLTDLMEVRRSIEATALTLCFASITTENVETLQDYTAKSQLALQNSQIYDAIKYDLLFHDFFFHKCGNLLLSEMWSLIRNRIMFVQSYTKQRKLPAGYTPTNHQPIIDAMVQGDLGKTKTALQTHIEQAILYIDYPIFTPNATPEDGWADHLPLPQFSSLYEKGPSFQ